MSEMIAVPAPPPASTCRRLRRRDPDGGRRSAPCCAPTRAWRSASPLRSPRCRRSRISTTPGLRQPHEGSRLPGRDRRFRRRLHLVPQPAQARRRHRQDRRRLRAEPDALGGRPRFVLTLVELAQNLGLKTIAEWVQDEAAAAMLAGWGGDYLQGKLVGWPRSSGRGARCAAGGSKADDAGYSRAICPCRSARRAASASRPSGA